MAAHYRRITAATDAADRHHRKTQPKETTVQHFKTRILILAPAAILIAQIVGGIRYSG